MAFPEYGQHFADLFGASSRAVLAQFPTAEGLARVDIRRLTRLLKDASRGAFGRGQAQALKASTKASFALTHRTRHLSMEIRFVMERVNLLIEQIAQLDEQLQDLMTEQQSLLWSVPGLGPCGHRPSWPRSCPVFHPEDQHGARKLVATAGLDVKQFDSGDLVGRGRMSKRGSRYLRTAVMQASEIAVFKSHDPLFTQVYQRHIDRGKHHLVALTHVANKMLHVVFSVLKNIRPYTPIPRVIHGEDTESADARVGDWCGLVARRWVFEEAGAACGSRSLARICAIAGIAVECG